MAGLRDLTDSRNPPTQATIAYLKGRLPHLSHLDPKRFVFRIKESPIGGGPIELFPDVWQPCILDNADLKQLDVHISEAPLYKRKRLEEVADDASRKRLRSAGSSGAVENAGENRFPFYGCPLARRLSLRDVRYTGKPFSLLIKPTGQAHEHLSVDLPRHYAPCTLYAAVASLYSLKPSSFHLFLAKGNALVPEEEHDAISANWFHCRFDEGREITMTLRFRDGDETLGGAAAGVPHREIKVEHDP